MLAEFGMSAGIVVQTYPPLVWRLHTQRIGSPATRTDASLTGGAARARGRLASKGGAQRYERERPAHGTLRRTTHDKAADVDGV